MSDQARELLSELYRAPDAFLFGSTEASAPFKLIAGTATVSVPHHIVNELQVAGYLDGGDIGAGDGEVYISFRPSDEGRSRSRLPG
jgi:hypothetical protein